MQTLRNWGCARTRVWAHVHQPGLTQLGWSCSSVRGCPQNAIWLEKQVICKDNLMCHHQIPHHPGQQTDYRTCLRVISQKKNTPKNQKKTLNKKTPSPCPSPLSLQLKVAGEPAPGTQQPCRAGSYNPLWSSVQQKGTLQQPGVVQEKAEKEQSLFSSALEPGNQLQLGTLIPLAVKQRDGSICSSFSVGQSLWKANSAQALHSVLSTLLRSPFSSHPKSPANQENAPEDCSCWQATVQRSSGLLPWAAAAKSGSPLWIPGCRNWSVSSWEKGGCLEDVGKIFLIGTESLQSISRELGRNGVRVLKRVGSAAALPGNNAQGSQVMEHEPGHSWRKGNTCCQQSPGHQRDTKMSSRDSWFCASPELWEQQRDTGDALNTFFSAYKKCQYQNPKALTVSEMVPEN